MFKAHRPDLALIDSSLMLGAAIATTVAFGRISPAAGILMSPVVPWVGFATALNYWILRNNPHASTMKADPKDGDISLLFKGGNQTSEQGSG